MKLDKYSFLLSKNTLQKKFYTQNILSEFSIDILENPLELLQACLSNNLSNISTTKSDKKETIYLPLYGGNRKVYENSGLNQWNAKGRKRDANEVYIPVPSIIHKKFPDFFPPRETPFALKLPNGTELQSKLCQDNSKALMSYSNKELGRWILRDVLQLPEGEILTYAKLQNFGVDSVRIDKIDSLRYEINFATIGSYENFINTNIDD